MGPTHTGPIIIFPLEFGRVCVCLKRETETERDREFQWSTSHPSSSPSLKPHCISPLDLWNNHYHHHFWFAWFYCYSDWVLYFATRAVLSHAVSRRPKGPITPHRNTAVGLGGRACWAGGYSPLHEDAFNPSISIFCVLLLDIHTLFYLKHILLTFCCRRIKLLLGDLGVSYPFLRLEN